MTSRPLIWIGAAAVLLAIVAGVVTDAGAPARQQRLLVVATVPPSYRNVAQVYDSDGRLVEVRHAPADNSLSWSPNGTLLAIANREGVWVERADGSERRRLLAIRTTCTSFDPQTTGFVLVNLANGRIMVLRPPKPSAIYVPIAFTTRALHGRPTGQPWP